MDDGKNILLEGAQGCWLDITYGQYPFVTSAYTTAAVAALETGLAMNEIDGIIGVFKAYSTYVGNGAYIGECDEKNGDFIVEKGEEFGTTTGRKRRVGWLSIPMLKDAIQINGTTELFLTKLDVLSGLYKIKLVKSYKLDGKEIDYVPSNPADYSRCEPIYEEFSGWTKDLRNIRSSKDLPINAQKYIDGIERLIDRRINAISVGPEREQFFRISLLYEKDCKYPMQWYMELFFRDSPC